MLPRCFSNGHCLAGPMAPCLSAHLAHGGPGFELQQPKGDRKETPKQQRGTRKSGDSTSHQDHLHQNPNEVPLVPTSTAAGHDRHRRVGPCTPPQGCGTAGPLHSRMPFSSAVLFGFVVSGVCLSPHILKTTAHGLRRHMDFM